MVRESDVRIVLLGGGRRQQNDSGRRRRLLRSAHQLLPDTLPLVRLPHGQIGEVGGVAEIGEGPCDANQDIFIPGGDYEVGIAEHLLHAAAVIDRTPVPESGGPIQIDHGIQIQIVAGSIGNGNHGRRALQTCFTPRVAAGGFLDFFGALYLAVGLNFLAFFTARFTLGLVSGLGRLSLA